MDLARVLREVGRHFLTDECPFQVRDLEVAVDRVVIGDGDEIHPAFAEQPIELARIAVAIREIETPEEPLFRTVAEAGMNVQVAAAHDNSLGPAPGPPLRDPIAISRRVAVLHEPVG